VVQLPYRSESGVTVPQVIRSHENGKIPKDLLQPCGLRTFTMVEPAARACRAMVAAASADGVRLDASGTYRSYEEQLQMFTERYSTTPLPDRPTRTWQGVEYWLKPGVPSAAAPGKSFHGWGLAADLDRLDATTLAWLAEHGPTFGFWNSVKSEEWHWPYFPGDDIPDAVLQFERSGKAPAPPKQPAPKPAAKPAPAAAPRRGALVAAEAAFQAGFRGADLTDITMIAGRESGWQSDRINPRTSDRGMWQINWTNLQRDGYADLRRRLGIDDEMDLLDLGTNAAVAFAMYQDSVKAGKPWFPWRASDSGHKQAGPGWDPDGSHTWRTEQFAAEAAAAAKAVLAGGGGTVPATTATTATATATTATASGNQRGTYVIVASDSDGISATVGRCLGIADAPFALRRAAAEAVAQHSGVAVDATWRPGDTIRFPPTIDGVRCYTVQPGDGLLAIARGLGLGETPAAQQRVTAINAWQGPTPHPGDTWYGGTA
jgi:hypothetical protein